MSTLGLLTSVAPIRPGPDTPPLTEAAIEAIFSGNAMANYLSRHEGALTRCACGFYMSNFADHRNHRACCPVKRWLCAVESLHRALKEEGAL